MRPLVSDIVARLPSYVPGRSIEAVRRELGLQRIIKLASNESPFGPSPKAMAAMRLTLDQASRYPDEGLALREALSARLGWDAEQIVLGAGATDLIELCVRTFGTSEGHALVSQGSFVAYKLFLLASGVPFTETPLKDWSIDLDALADSARPNTQLLFLPNPNNPTGSRFDQKTFERFLRKLPPDVVLVLDDAYRDYNDAPIDTVAAIRSRPRTVVLQSFSKVHGLAGMRVGYALSSDELTCALRRVQRPFSVSRVALEGALAALDDEEHFRRTVEGTRGARVRVTKILGEMGFQALPSHTNFVTLVLPSEEAAARFTHLLLQRGCIIRHLASFGLPCCVRISMGAEEELDSALAAVAAIVREEPQLCRARSGVETER